MPTTTAHRSPAYLAAIRAELLAPAEAAVARYPQYAGHFDRYLVAKVTRTIKHRGTALPVGTLVLIDPARIRTATDPVDWLPSSLGHTFATIWHPANHVDTTVRADYLEVLG